MKYIINIDSNDRDVSKDIKNILEQFLLNRMNTVVVTRYDEVET